MGIPDLPFRNGEGSRLWIRQNGLQKLVGVFCAVELADCVSQSIKAKVIPPKWQICIATLPALLPPPPSPPLLSFPFLPLATATAPCPTPPMPLCPSLRMVPISYSDIIHIPSCPFHLTCQATIFAWKLSGLGILSKTKCNVPAILSRSVAVQVLCRLAAPQLPSIRPTQP